MDCEQKFDLVGITGYTAEIPSTYAVADQFRKRGIQVVLGGVHVSARPEEALKHADAVVVGEAEGVWKQLLTDFESGELQTVYHSDSLCEMEKMRIPRRELLNRDMYTTYYTIQATRGCPYDCDYCAVTGVFGRKFRMRPVYVTEVVSGGAPGVDTLGERWGGQNGISITRLPSEWSRYGRKAGPIRNKEMAEYRQALIAVWDGESRGTGNMIRQVRKCGLKVVSYLRLPRREPAIIPMRLEPGSSYGFRRMGVELLHAVQFADIKMILPKYGTKMFLTASWGLAIQKPPITTFLSALGIQHVMKTSFHVSMYGC